MKRFEPVKLVMNNLKKHDLSNDSSNMRILIDKNLDMSQDDRNLISKFCKMCYSVLEIEGDYRCYLTSDRKRSKIVTTAICDLAGGNIHIYCRHRALADILRSIGHEMFHLRQNELGLVHPHLKKHYLEPIEWHANVIGGSLLSYFASKVGRDKIYR